MGPILNKLLNQSVLHFPPLKMAREILTAVRFQGVRVELKAKDETRSQKQELWEEVGIRFKAG